MSDTDNTDDECEYRVRTDQAGRANKPHRHNGRDINPGETFRATTRLLDALADRLERVDGDADATPQPVDPDPEPEPMPDPAGDESGAEDSDADAGDDADPEPGSPEDIERAASEAAEAVRERDADDSDAGADAGGVNQQALVDDLGYDDMSVPEIREMVAERDLSNMARRALLAYERSHDDRKTAKDALSGA